MSIAKKLALFVLPAVALALPLMATTSAQAYDHHERFERRVYHPWVHYDHHGYDHLRIVPQVVLSPVAPITVGVGVAVQPVSVFYRYTPASPWVVYASYGTLTDAQLAANSLTASGLQVFIR